MNLKEAILHAKEQSEKQGCTECGKEHKQLANWLEELQNNHKQLISQFNLGIIDAVLVPRNDGLAKEAFSYGIYYYVINDKILLYKYDYQLKMLLLAREQKIKKQKNT